MSRPSPGEHPARAMRFKCRRCGRCCRELEIPVVISDVELWVEGRRFDILARVRVVEDPDLLKYLGISRYFSFEKDDATCPFYEDGLCSIYPVRPLVCRLFPFAYGGSVPAFHPWAVRNCPGIGLGEPYSRVELEIVRKLSSMILRELVGLKYCSAMIEDLVALSRRKVKSAKK